MLKKCEKCGSYSLSEKCGCGGKTRIPNPPKFSLPDKYGRYRRLVKGV